MELCSIYGSALVEVVVWCSMMFYRRKSPLFWFAQLCLIVFDCVLLGYVYTYYSPLGKVLRDTIKVRGPLSVHDYMSQVR